MESFCIKYQDFLNNKLFIHRIFNNNEMDDGYFIIYLYVNDFNYPSLNEEKYFEEYRNNWYDQIGFAEILKNKPEIFKKYKISNNLEILNKINSTSEFEYSNINQILLEYDKNKSSNIWYFIKYIENNNDRNEIFNIFKDLLTPDYDYNIYQKLTKKNQYLLANGETKIKLFDIKDNFYQTRFTIYDLNIDFEDLFFFDNITIKISNSLINNHNKWLNKFLQPIDEKTYYIRKKNILMQQIKNFKKFY
jgi:hypothetical protein